MRKISQKQSSVQRQRKPLKENYSSVADEAQLFFPFFDIANARREAQVKYDKHGNPRKAARHAAKK